MLACPPHVKTLRLCPPPVQGKSNAFQSKLVVDILSRVEEMSSAGKSLLNDLEGTGSQSRFTSAGRQQYVIIGA